MVAAIPESFRQIDLTGIHREASSPFPSVEERVNDLADRDVEEDLIEFFRRKRAQVDPQKEPEQNVHVSHQESSMPPTGILFRRNF